MHKIGIKMKKMIIFIFLSLLACENFSIPTNPDDEPSTLTATMAYSFLSAQENNSDYPYGMYFIGFFIKSGEELLKDSLLVKSIEISNPPFYQIVRPNVLFNISDSLLILNGFFDQSFAREWRAINANYHYNNMPPKGEYIITITDIYNKKSFSIFRFDYEDEPPIDGFPKNLQYNFSTRVLTWDATTGQVGYRVCIHWGELAIPHTIFYYSDAQHITENSFKIPVGVQFEKGKKYIFNVTALDAFNVTDANYYNISENLIIVPNP